MFHATAAFARLFDFLGRFSKLPLPQGDKAFVSAKADSIYRSMVGWLSLTITR